MIRDIDGKELWSSSEDLAYFRHCEEGFLDYLTQQRNKEKSMSVFHEEGNYNAEIIDANIITATAGNNQVEITIQLHWLWSKDEKEKFEPAHSRFPPRIFLSITEKTMGTPAEPGWVAQTLAYVGFKGDFDNIKEIIGWRGNVNCTYQKNQKNEQRENWNIIRPFERRETAPVEKKVTRSLNALYGNSIKAAAADLPPQPPQQQPKPAVTAAPSANGTPDPNDLARESDDDIPF